MIEFFFCVSNIYMPLFRFYCIRDHVCVAFDPFEVQSVEKFAETKILLLLETYYLLIFIMTFLFGFGSLCESKVN